jgi:hypothetical protein
LQDETYTKAVLHFGFILHENKSEKMATKKAATATTLTAVFALEDDSEMTNPLNVAMAKLIACCEYLEKRFCCSSISFSSAGVQLSTNACPLWKLKQRSARQRV